MKLVVQVYYTDDCTYSFTETVPVIYDSPEAFLVDFEVLANKALAEIKFPHRQVFKLGGQVWEAADFFKGSEFQAPTILTLEEWYEACERQL